MTKNNGVAPIGMLFLLIISSIACSGTKNSVGTITKIDQVDYPFGGQGNASIPLETYITTSFLSSNPLHSTYSDYSIYSKIAYFNPIVDQNASIPYGADCTIVSEYEVSLHSSQFNLTNEPIMCQWITGEWIIHPGVTIITTRATMDMNLANIRYNQNFTSWDKEFFISNITISHTYGASVMYNMTYRLYYDPARYDIFLDPYPEQITPLWSNTTPSSDVNGSSPLTNSTINEQSSGQNELPIAIRYYWPIFFFLWCLSIYKERRRNIM